MKTKKQIPNDWNLEKATLTMLNPKFNTKIEYITMCSMIQYCYQSKTPIDIIILLKINISSIY